MTVNTSTERRALGTRHEKGRGKAPTTKVGFYGCVGKVVRLEATDYFPTNIRIKCPGCGHTHLVRPFWRKRIEQLDEGMPPQMVLIKEDDSAIV